ncbi:copper chaperone for superoxide dismutase isoform X6 [Ambystoma mexicanum]|uniref:copper chaperone for superoxide dismutase isoform X6 n=1 Tax=Ambystoma mexicanum TaxID=8296 RepID=UPI0037E984A0
MEKPKTKLEFAVQMTCQSCVQAIERCLQGIKGVQAVQVSLDSESVLVETTLTAEEVQNLLESTGRLAVLKGMGGSIERDLGAAVTMMEGANCIQGVVRFVQVSEDKCIVEGTIDGLRPGLHGLHVHAFGDLTDSFRKCGDHFNPQMNSHGGPQDPDRVWDIIGRSLVVDEVEDDLGRGEHPLSKITGNSGERLAGGIIARSAGLFENPKQFCACDGTTLWDERDRARGNTRRRLTPLQPSANL